SLEGIEKRFRGPSLTRLVSSNRRIETGKLGRRAFEHEPVNGAHQAQAEHRASRVRVMTFQNLPGWTTCLDVACRPFQEEVVERRADQSASRRLPPQPSRHSFSGASLVRSDLERVASR